MKSAALSALIAIWATASGAQGLSCVFTLVCSPQTDCQASDGVPFDLMLISGAFAFMADGQLVYGTPLSNMDAPGLSLLFDTQPNTTLLVSVAASGEAVMTQHDISATNGNVQSVSFFGTCEAAQ